jgi:hypothetical protein
MIISVRRSLSKHMAPVTLPIRLSQLHTRTYVFSMTLGIICRSTFDF